MITNDGKRVTASPSLWSRLPTEARHPGSLDLDALPTGEAVRLVLEEDRRGLEAALEHAAVIAAVAERLAETLAQGHKVILAGAGTSGRQAVLEAAECPPTFGTEPGILTAVMAGGEDAVFRAKEGAEDRAEDGLAAAESLGPGDLLIGISASSVTPFVRGALDEARRRGAGTVLLTCAAAAGLEGAAETVLALDTGPEVLTGSTRLKAGSATKAALNAITTAAMVRLGKVFENLMVDLRPGSAKLEDRALRIIAEAVGTSSEDAKRLHAEAEGHVKVAILMGKLGIGNEDARRRLEAAAGHVRRALS